MQVFVILMGNDQFCTIRKSEEAAQRYIKQSIEDGFDFDYKIHPFDLNMSIEEHETVINETILGHCISCDEKLTKSNVRYNSSNEPFWCEHCYPNS